MENTRDLRSVQGEVLQLAVADATRAIEQQSSKLEEHRGRAATILGAASIVAGFLGSSAFDRLETPAFKDDRELYVLVAVSVGLMAFVCVAVLACVTLRPSKGWAFGRSPEKLIVFVTHPATTDPDAYRRFTLEDLASDHRGNEQRLKPLTTAVRWAVYALIIETLGFLVALM